MITESNRDNLYRITSNLSFRDYNSALTAYKKHHSRIKNFSYSLSSDTLEALEHYKTACKQNITHDEEKTIKAYLLKIRLAYPELWDQTNGNYKQWIQSKGA